MRRNLVLGRDVGSHTADVECTKGKLRTWFSDGLCRYDSDRFSFLNHPACREVASITFRADAMFGFASKH